MSGMQAWRRNMAAIERSVDAAVAAVKDERAAAWEAAKERAKESRAAEAENRPSVESIQASRLARTRYGWFHIVRVNAKTVTLSRPDGWRGRVDLGEVLEVSA